MRGILALAGVVFALSLTGATLASAAGGYTINETGVPLVSGLTVTIQGLAGGHPYVGQDDQQHVSIDWDNDGNWVDADTFGPVFGGSGNDKFFDGIWSGSHTYSTYGEKTIKVKVYHGNINGAEASETSTITIDVVLDVCANLEGTQATVPDGYTADGDQCTPIVVPPTDVCPNLDGIQESVPDGYTLNNDGQCVPTEQQPSTGVLVIKKVFATGAIDPSQFSFTINGGDPISFNESGENDITEAPGSYTIVETATSTYMPSYDGCSEVSVSAGATTTCTITNTLVTPDNGGSGDNGSTSTDVCPNIDGVQATVPDGDTLNNDGQCVPTNNGGSGDNGGSGNGGGSPSTSSGSSSGGGNGPIVGTYGNSGGGGNGPIIGQVLGASTSSLPDLPAGCTALLGSYMRLGKHNDVGDVKKLQQFLNDNLKLDLPITGFFGKQTDAAVRSFQQAHPAEVLTPWGISDATGYVYKTTQRWINLMSCSSLVIPMPELN